MAAILNIPHRYVLASIITSLALAGCGGGGGSSSPKVRTSSTFNLNGDWTITERVKNTTCPADGLNVGDEHREIYQIIQNQNTLTVTSMGETLVTGELDGSRAQLAGIYTDTAEGFRVNTKVDMTVMTNDRFEGTETAVLTLLDSNQKCTFVFSFDGNRVSSTTREAHADDTPTLDTTPDGDTPDLSEALPLRNGVMVSSSVNSSGNQFDIYRLDVEAGSNLSVLLDGFADTGSDLDLFLLNSDSAPLAESVNQADSAESLNLYIAEATTLYLVVKASDTGSQDINFNLLATIR